MSQAASMYLQGRLPGWFNRLIAFARLLAVSRSWAEAVPRPYLRLVTIGEAEQCAAERAVVDDMRMRKEEEEEEAYNEACMSVLAPSWLGVGICRMNMHTNSVQQQKQSGHRTYTMNGLGGLDSTGGPVLLSSHQRSGSLGEAEPSGAGHEAAHRPAASDPMAAFAKYPMQNLQTFMQVLSKEGKGQGGNAPSSELATPTAPALPPAITRSGTPAKTLVEQMLGNSSRPSSQRPSPAHAQQPQQQSQQPQQLMRSPPPAQYRQAPPQQSGRVRTARVEGDMSSMPLFKVPKSAGSSGNGEIMLSPRSAKMLVDVVHEGLQRPTDVAQRDNQPVSCSARTSWAEAKTNCQRGALGPPDARLGEDGFSTPTHARLRTGVAETLRLHPFDSTSLDINDKYAMRKVNHYMAAARARLCASHRMRPGLLQDKTNLQPQPLLGK
eukprot:jgi/Tetstr1/442100/TSEL_030258.t2